MRGAHKAAAARISLAKAKSVEGALNVCAWLPLCRFRLDRVLQGSGSRGHGFGLQDRQHLVARSVSQQTAIVKQQQPIDHVEKREAVCRNDDGHPLIANGFQALQELGFAPNIKMGCRLIEEQYPGFPDQHAGKTDRLLLASRQAATALGNRHVVSHRMTGNKALDT